MGSYAQAPRHEELRSIGAHCKDTGVISVPSGMGGKGGLPLARQSSIYSLTLDEFQNVLGEPGKGFGSMNMDEFLKNIWTAEESQAMAAAMGGTAAGVCLDRQQSLPRQGSLSLPRTLSRKTVDDVWKDIHRESDAGMDGASGGQQRQTTFGEITLEDFLVKAGVARENIDPGGQAFPPFGASLEVGFDVGGEGAVGVNYAEKVSTVTEVGGEKGGGSVLPTLSLSPANGNTNSFTGQVAAIDPMQLNTFKHASPAPQQTEWISSQYRSPMTPQPMTPQQHQSAEVAAVYANAAKRMGNGYFAGPLTNGLETLGPVGGGLPGGLFGPCIGVGFGTGFDQTALGLGAGSPSSPTSDATGHGDISNFSPVPYGLDGHFRGRKRGFEGPLEKIVERRQRRMIKNRESAARSRARKQAYTVELEAEVTQLKQENMLLRRQQEEIAEKRRKQFFYMKAPLSQQLASRVRVLRRTCTVPW